MNWFFCGCFLVRFLLSNEVFVDENFIKKCLQEGWFVFYYYGYGCVKREVLCYGQIGDFVGYGIYVFIGKVVVFEDNVCFFGKVGYIFF